MLYCTAQHCSVHQHKQQHHSSAYVIVIVPLPPAGYDEAAATAPERLLAHTLQEVLLLHSPPGSSVYPVAVDEDDASETLLDARWPKSTLRGVLQAAQQPYRVHEFKQHLAGRLKALGRGGRPALCSLLSLYSLALQSC
jgi:hypothetical protein